MFVLMEMKSNQFLKSIKIDGVDVSVRMTNHISQAMVLDDLEDCTKLFEIETLPLKRSTWTVFKLDSTAVNMLEGFDSYQLPKLSKPQMKSIRKSINIVDYVLWNSFNDPREYDDKFEALVHLNIPRQREARLNFIKNNPENFGYASYKNVKRSVRDNIGIPLERLLDASDEYCFNLASDISDLRQRLIDQESSNR